MWLTLDGWAWGEGLWGSAWLWAVRADGVVAAVGELGRFVSGRQHLGSALRIWRGSVAGLWLWLARAEGLRPSRGVLVQVCRSERFRV